MKVAKVATITYYSKSASRIKTAGKLLIVLKKM